MIRYSEVDKLCTYDELAALLDEAEAQVAVLVRVLATFEHAACSYDTNDRGQTFPVSHCPACYGIHHHEPECWMAAALSLGPTTRLAALPALSDKNLDERGLRR